MQESNVTVQPGSWSLTSDPSAGRTSCRKPRGLCGEFCSGLVSGQGAAYFDFGSTETVEDSLMGITYAVSHP